MIVTVMYHQEGETAWAESADLEGYSVAGDSIAQVRELVRDGLPFYLDDGDFELREQFDEFAMPTGVLVSVGVGTSGGAIIPAPKFEFTPSVMPGATVKASSAVA